MEQNEILKEKLKRQDKLASIGALSAGIAHEVRNPLNFVLNFSKLSSSLIHDLIAVIQENKDNLAPEALDEIREIADDLTLNMRHIDEHGTRALSIVNGILLQSRGRNMEFLPTDMPSLVHEYIWLSYHAARAADSTFNLSVKEEYPSGMPKVLTVPQDMSRALVNALNNAFYAVNERRMARESGYSPQVKVTLTYRYMAPGHGEMTLSVQDNGTGMSSETRQKLFDDFFTTKPAGQGTGLGMGIINEIVTEEHKGRLELESSPGHGTTISFIIPVRSAE